MSKISTNNLFIKSLYEELSPTEKSRLEKNLSWMDRQENMELADIARTLEPVRKNPTQTSIEIILNYSKKTSELDAII